MVHSPVFSLLTNPTTHPSQFTITCPSSSTPPLSTVWSRDGATLTVDEGVFETSQVLVNASTSLYNNVLSVSGDLVGVYRCEVGNNRGSNSRSLTVRGETQGKFCDHNRPHVYIKFATELQVLCTFCIIEIVLIYHISVFMNQLICSCTVVC